MAGTASALGVWSALMVSHLHFLRRVAPAASRLRAEDERYRIVERRWAGALAWPAFDARGNGLACRIVVRDREGREHAGLAIVENFGGFAS